tara:strand:- start:278 stop:589 length:312 start_codon:yes stop_codon:yes gene_type:complete
MNLKKIFTVGLISATALLSGCGGGYENISCKDLREEIIDLSEEQQAFNGFSIIKIYEPTLVSRTEQRVVCNGIAAWTDAEETNIQYEAYTDRDGDWMIQYEPY